MNRDLRGGESQWYRKSKKEQSLVETVQQKASELSHDRVQAPQWLHNSFCAKGLGRDGSDSSWSLVFSTSESLGEEKAHPEGKAICSFPSWKFTPIC